MSEPQDIKAIEHVQALLLGYDPTQGGADAEVKAAAGHHGFEQEQDQEQEQEQELEEEQQDLRDNGLCYQGFA